MLFTCAITKWPQETDYESPVGRDKIQMAKAENNDASLIKIINES